MKYFRYTILFLFLYDIVNSSRYDKYCKRLQDHELQTIVKASVQLDEGVNGTVYQLDCAPYSFINGYGENAIIKVPKEPSFENDEKEIKFMETMSKYKSFPKYLGCLYHYTSSGKLTVFFMLGRLKYNLTKGADEFRKKNTLERLQYYLKLFQALDVMH